MCVCVGVCVCIDIVCTLCIIGVVNVLYCIVFIDNIIYDLKMQILNSRFTNIERTTKDKTPVKHKSPRMSVQSYTFIVLCKIY